MSKTTKQDMAAAILAMSYNELIAVADGLAELARKRPPESKEEFAALLHGWAQAQ